MVGCATALIGRPLTVMSARIGAHGMSIVPDAVVHELVVPLALAGLQIDARPGSRRTGCCPDDGRRSSRRSAARPADRRGRAPRRRVICVHTPVLPVYGPRVVLPRVVAELARPRNRVEDPQPLAGPHVEAADVALHVGLALRARRRSRCAAPMMTTSLRDDRRRRAGRSRRSRDRSSWSSSCFRSTTPFLPKPATGAPVFASSAISW